MTDNNEKLKAVVECERLTKVYSSVWAGRSKAVCALSDVSLSVSKGQIVGLIGPNGAGKTTLLKLIAGLIVPNQGRISICTHPVRSIEARRRLGYMPEYPAFQNRYSARAVLQYHAGLMGLPRPEIASGRICVLIIKPLWLGELFIYRLMGLSLQALAHLLISGVILFTLHSATGRGTVKNLGLWMLSAWLIFTTFAALSTSISVVVRRGQNSMLLFAAIAFVYSFVMLIISFFPKHTATEVFMGFRRYACPPVELLGNLAMGKYSVIKSLGCALHSLALMTVYRTVGIIILCKRQFVCVCD